MKNIHVLPTNKPSRLLYNFTMKSFCIQKEKDGMFINDGKVRSANFWSIEKAQNNGFQPQNIYITSDEEIKEGDWFYLDDAEIVAKHINAKPVKEAKKIILTTDTDLIKDGVQPIDDEFLEWFVKNPNCEFADVNDWMSTNGSIAFGADKRYQICNHIYPKTIIPQEEPKPHSFCETPESKCTMNYCDENGCQNRKRELVEPQEEHKQETTLEEAALRQDYTLGVEYCAYIEGAKWQQERSYNEKEVEVIAKDAYAMGRNNILIGVFNKWFEKFKKK